MWNNKRCGQNGGIIASWGYFYRCPLNVIRASQDKVEEKNELLKNKHKFWVSD